MPSWIDIPLPKQLNASDRLTHLNNRIPPLRALADKLLNQAKHVSNTSSVLDLMGHCRTIETALISWHGSLPETWKYSSVVYISPSIDKVYYQSFRTDHGSVDLYTDIWIARSWNSYRTTRIFVQIIRLACIIWLVGDTVLLPSLGHDSSEPCGISAYTGAKKVLQQMVDDICASVPFHMGYLINSQKGSSGKLPTAASTGDEGTFCADSLGIYFLFWPLFVARSVYTTPKIQKKWIDSVMLRAAEHCVFDEALIPAKLSQGFQWPLLERGPKLYPGVESLN